MVDKSQTYVPKLLKKAKGIHKDHLWDDTADDDLFAQDTLTSASELLPHWGSKKMFLAHLPVRAVAPTWTTLEGSDKDSGEVIQQDLVQWLESSGHNVKIHPRSSQKGIPDLLIDEEILVEVKKDLGTQKARYAIGQVLGYAGQYTKAIAGPASDADLDTIQNAGISVYLQLEPGKWVFIQNN